MTDPNIPGSQADPDPNPNPPNPSDDQNDNPDPPRSEVDVATEKHLADLRKENASWRKKLRAAEADLDKVKTSAASDIEKAKAEARQEALTEATAEANKRIVRAEVIAAASGKLRDPVDAAAYIDLSTVEVDDEGNVDRKGLVALVDELVKAKPYLGVSRDPEFGSRTPVSPAASTDQAMDNWLRAAAGRRI